MNSKDYNNLDLDLKNVNSEIAGLIRNLVNEKVKTRKAARNRLVDLGNQVLPIIYGLFESKNSLLRWEASKVIQEIASHEAIPLLISLLEAEESEIRWIAAEGLIQVGRPSIKPLLEELIKQSEERHFLNAGAHHVLSVLFYEKEKEHFHELLHKLRSIGLFESIPVLARKALKEGTF